MPKFCPKCGKTLKPRAGFCPACGAKMKVKQTAQPVAVGPAFAPPSRASAGKSSGCGTGCLIGCLITALVILLILAVLVGLAYYFLFIRETEAGSYFDVDSKSGKTVKCDTPSCLEENLKKCAPAKGETEIENFAEVEFEILGQSKGSCVVYAEVSEIKEVPPGLEAIPDFILNKLLENLTFECLIPESVYSKGIDEVGEYIGDNLNTACKGPLFDLMEKFGVEVEELN